MATASTSAGIHALQECDLQTSEELVSYSTFSSMGLKLEILKAIYNYGFERPSLIQQKCIHQIANGRDVIAQAQSGTGKTATFVIGTLQLVKPELKKIQTLILCPTRELASQIHKVVSSLSEYLSVRCVACCGGRNNVAQMARELEKGAHVVVGTPGRVLDLLRQGNLRVDSLVSLVLDEADEMVNRGLRDQLGKIFQLLPSSTTGMQTAVAGGRPQVIIVSATMPKEHLESMRQLTREPVHILVPRDELSLDALRQFHIDVGDEEWKFEALNDLFASLCVSQTVVFVNTRRKVDWLAGRLRKDHFTVAAAHGDLDQSQREHVMQQFRAGLCRILVSSDVWARGIDVQNVSMVVNYDLPATTSDYLHRIGRSGRFGRKGLAVSLVAGSEDQRQLVSICRYYRVDIPPAPAELSQMWTGLSREAPAAAGVACLAGSRTSAPSAVEQGSSGKTEKAKKRKGADEKRRKRKKKKRKSSTSVSDL